MLWLNAKRPPVKELIKGTFTGIQKKAVDYLVSRSHLSPFATDANLRSYARLVAMTCYVDGYESETERALLQEFLLAEYGGDRRAMQEDARETVVWCKESNPMLSTEEEFQEAMRKWSTNLEVR